MTIDPGLFKKLIGTFTTELDEQTQTITQGLLEIEKKPSADEKEKTITAIFRAAHNIKGTARSLGIGSVAEIAHALESLFSDIQKNKLPITQEIINSGLSSVDKMRSAMLAFTTAKLEPQESTDSNLNDSIRVPVESIERISALLEELQINKIAIEDHRSEFSPSMKDRCNELSTLSSSLQDEVRMLRLIPAANMLSHMPRYVRDLSIELNKKVDLVIKGDEVKLDKIVLEKLKDPIIHLLRNSVDHGIEDPSTRLASGKPETGTIILHIKEESGKIHLSIKDDGAGIDNGKIAMAAETRNLVSKAELAIMDQHQLINLIFKPGFSTTEKITDISGRGIGLDIVNSNVNNLNGSISVSTIPGKSTTFDLSFPLTIESERGLIVNVSGDYYAIPTHSIQRVMAIKKNQIAEVEGCEVIILDHNPIPLHSLNTLIGLDHHELIDEDQYMIVILEKDTHMIAVLVDEIVGEKEIVVKPLQAPLAKIPCIAGGTLSGGNQVMIVLDPASLLATAKNTKSTQHITAHTEAVKDVEIPHILVVDDSITTRTLEKSVLESKNYQVTVAVNGRDAWNLLQKQRFSLLITDINMPIMDGFTLTEHVKQSEKLRHLPVIIVTSLGSEEEKKRGIDAGADAYVVKSEFESGALLQIVKQLV